MNEGRKAGKEGRNGGDSGGYRDIDITCDI